MEMWRWETILSFSILMNAWVIDECLGKSSYCTNLKVNIWKSNSSHLSLNRKEKVVVESEVSKMTQAQILRILMMLTTFNDLENRQKQ